MAFLGYQNPDGDPNAGPLATSRLYRFCAGFLTIAIFALVCGWRPWNNDLRDWWNVVFGSVVGIGAVREGVGFVNYVVLGRFFIDTLALENRFVILLVALIGGLIYLNLFR